MNTWTIKVLKSGINDKGQWALVDLSDEIIKYNGIVNMDKKYELKVNQVYDVKTIDVKQSSKNAKLYIKIGL